VWVRERVELDMQAFAVLGLPFICAWTVWQTTERRLGTSDEWRALAATLLGFAVLALVGFIG
jgi:hypothetical protein